MKPSRLGEHTMKKTIIGGIKRCEAFAKPEDAMAYAGELVAV